ncbi:PREDICTED: AFP homolog 2-like isoform X2 [Tarenaya hassleriana]|uniref:AFP homolog 2-like isoform X2 n=1 Tax=Tarenaya hassleriana TaxID=28532 RepID=UPI00053C7925|nr:PREDICTED: AFP homolog 2-like isoform X2 [Tarenaya hassleriana]
MEDNNGLELSLGLSCGGLSGKNKGNNSGNASDNHKVEGGDISISSKVIDDLKKFLQSNSQRQDPSSCSRRSDSDKSPQNFFTDLSKAPTADAEASAKPFSAEDETQKEAGNKRKFLSLEKKNEKDVPPIDLREKKMKTSHISIATDEGSTAENEDVAESEIGTSDASKKIGQWKTGSVPLPLHPIDVPNSPSPLQAKDSGNATSVGQPASSGNLPIVFEYSTVQLPTLDKDGVTPSRPPYPDRGMPNSGSSNQAKEAKGGARDGNGDETSFPFEFSAIKLGIEAGVKFGGSGSLPNLPWVSTTGSGPHGRTISGVTYRYNPNQIKIVCACHGHHLSPEEFVRHASEELVNPESSIGLRAASAHS